MMNETATLFSYAVQADVLVAVLKDILLHMNLKLSNCHGQCYDGASNKVDSGRGAATQLTTEESCVFCTH